MFILVVRGGYVMFFFCCINDVGIFIGLVLRILFLLVMIIDLFILFLRMIFNSIIVCFFFMRCSFVELYKICFIIIVLFVKLMIVDWCFLLFVFLYEIIGLIL